MSQRPQYSQEIIFPLISINLPQGKARLYNFWQLKNSELNLQESLLCLFHLVKVDPSFPFLIFLQHWSRTGTPQCLCGFYKPSESCRALPAAVPVLTHSRCFVPSHRHASSCAVSCGAWKILQCWNWFVIKQKCNEKTDLNKKEWVWFIYKLLC